MNTLRTHLLLFLLLSPSLLFGQSGWIRQISHTTSDLNKLSFTDIAFGKGYATGADGTILQTTDQGDSWQQVSTTTSAAVLAVTFPYPDTCLAVASDQTLLKSTDGGMNWFAFTPLALPQPRDIYFPVQSRAGYMVGDSGLVVRSLDGGVTWPSRYNLGTSRNLHAMAFLDFTHIYAVGDSGAVYKRYSVTSWPQLTLPAGYGGVDFFGIAFAFTYAFTDTGWIVGANGSILHTLNAGSVWTAQQSNVGATLRSVSFFGSKIGFAVGDSGTIVATVDGGLHWSVQSSGTTATLRSVVCLSPTSAVVAGDGGIILKTWTGGAYAPLLVSSDRWIDFGSTQRTLPRVSHVYITNGGTAPLEISSAVATNSAFSVGPSSASVASLSTQRFDVTFSPSVDGPANGSLVFEHNAGGPPYEIPLSGFGEDPIEPSSWTWKNPSPQGNMLYGCTMVNATLGYAVGDGGTVMRTSDGGNSWATTNYAGGNRERLNDVVAASPTVIIAVGNHGVIVRSSDGGGSWKSISSGTTKDLLGVKFSVQSGVLAFGRDGYHASIVLHSTDDGYSWESAFNSLDVDLYDLALGGGTAGMACGISVTPYYAFGMLLRTTDGGFTWKKQSLGTQYFMLALAFAGPTTMIAAGYYGELYRSADAGTSWAITGTSADVVRRFAFGDSLHGLGLTQSGNTVQTTNGGISWSAGTSPSLLAVAAADAQHLLGVAGHSVQGSQVSYSSRLPQLFSSSDNGASWTPWMQAQATHYLTGISSPGPATSYIVGDYGTLLRSTDAGEHWADLLAGSLLQTQGVPLSAVAFTDTLTGTAVGANGTILRTTNGGSDWMQQLSNTTIWLHDVAMPDLVSEYAVGENGTVIRTTDGGTLWTLLPTGTSAILYALSVPDANTLVVSGTGGTVLYSSNAGAVWQARSTGSSADLYDAAFTSPTAGVVVGSGGTLLRTTDAGLSWIDESMPWAGDLIAVVFRNSSLGMISSNDGALYRTTDGGASWSHQWSGSVSPITHLAFSSDTVITAVGANGTILRTASGGVVISMVANEGSLFPIEFALRQNYPNPFNPATTIEYDLPSASRVVLKIYDLLGEEMTTLVDEEQAAGYKSVSFDASRYPSGVYFYRLVAGSRTSVRKMILIR